MTSYPRLGFAFTLLLAGAAAAFAAEPRWETLFNGRDLTGWVPDENVRIWRVAEGALVGENDAKLSGSMLWTDKNYGDVVIELEVRWEGPMDSGVFIRKPALQMQVGTSVSLKRDM